MLREHASPVDLVALAPALALQFEPVLARLDRLLDDDGIFCAVRDDFARRRPHTLETGRPSTPVEVVLRLLIVRRLYGWSYASSAAWGWSGRRTTPPCCAGRPCSRPPRCTPCWIMWWTWRASCG